MSKEKPPPQILLPLIPPLAQKLPIPIWQPFEDNPQNECVANIRCKGNCTHAACSQNLPQNPSAPKVIWYDCQEERFRLKINRWTQERQ